MFATPWITDHVWLDTLIVIGLIIGPALTGIRGAVATIPLVIGFGLIVFGVPVLALIGFIAAIFS